MHSGGITPGHPESSRAMKAARGQPKEAYSMPAASTVNSSCTVNSGSPGSPIRTQRAFMAAHVSHIQAASNGRQGGGRGEAAAL